MQNNCTVLVLVLVTKLYSVVDGALMGNDSFILKGGQNNKVKHSIFIPLDCFSIVDGG